MDLEKLFSVFAVDDITFNCHAKRAIIGHLTLRPIDHDNNINPSFGGASATELL